MKPGQRVEYHPVRRYTDVVSTGTIKRIITGKEVAGTTPRTIHADEEHPRESPDLLAVP